MSTKVTIRKVAGGADWGKGYAVKVGNEYIAEVVAAADSARKDMGTARPAELKADIRAARLFNMARAAVVACEVAGRRGLEVTPFVAKLGAGAAGVVHTTDKAADKVADVKRAIRAIDDQFKAANDALAALGQPPIPETVKAEQAGALVVPLKEAERALKAARAAENELNRKAADAMLYLRNVRQGEAN